jgi:MFS family permease
MPRGIWALGFVSMFMDISSELVHSLLPIFMVSVLGASMITIGLIEGIAEATAAITKVFSGAISDYFRKRKFLAVLGYGLSAITKLVFPLATTIQWVFTARLVDRIGKGIRGAPRDALVADIAPATLRGAAYGLRQALDSVGAFTGPLLAVLLMIWLANDIKAVLWVAVVPAFLAVLLLMVAVREPERPEHPADSKNRPVFADARRLPLRYWLVVALGAVFTLARFSEAFLILRAQDVGLAIAYVPVIMIVMNVVYAVFAYPAGIAADRISARTLLVFGLGVLIAADVVLALAAAPWVAFLGAALWGLHMALTQGLLSKLVADNAPTELFGTAFGVFSLVSGGALLFASVIAGALWSVFGASTTFIAGAGFAAAAALGLLLYRPGVRIAPRAAGE